MKLLALISSPTLTGVAAPVAGLVRRLHQIGLPVEVATDSLRTGDLQNHLKLFGVPIFNGLTLSSVARPDQYICDAFRLARRIRQESDLVLLVATSNDIWTAWTATKIARRPVPILGVLARNPDHLRSSQRATLSRCGAWLTVRKHWIVPASTILDADPNRFFSLPPDVDENRFRSLLPADRLSLRNRWGYESHQRIIGFVGRFKPGRGAKRIIRAFAGIAPDHPHARFLMVGFGENLPVCRWMAARYGLSRRIRFTGFLSESLPQAYGVMDALILPAVGNDGYGRAVLEALACGTPVWAPPESVLADFANDGAVPGGFLKSSDPTDLQRVFQEILSNRELVSSRTHRPLESYDNRLSAFRDFLKRIAA